MSGQAWRSRPPISETFPHIRVPWKAIAAELRDAIERGDMVPREPVASIAEMTSMYGVCRSTVRKALQAAAAEGLIELRAGKGYFVPPAPEAGRP